MLLAAEGAMTVEELDTWLEQPGPRRVREALRGIQRRLRQERRGWQLVEVARGWQLRTDVTFSRWVSAMRGGKPTRLSKAALETLAVVAYRQPVTRAEIEELRGVDVGGVLRTVVERDLVTVVGRRDEPGRPLVYGTTTAFLSLFGLRNLSDLPTLRDLRALQEDSAEGPSAGVPPPPKPPPPPPDSPAPAPRLTRDDLVPPTETK
jgi:segregation and condensation protein B